MAGHLLSGGYKDAAASIAGAVLENGLRTIAKGAGVSVKSREDISSLNHKCAAADVYSRLVQKKLQVWADVRNSAAHGKFEEYQTADVRDMIAGIEAFLGEHVK